MKNRIRELRKLVAASTALRKQIDAEFNRTLRLAQKAVKRFVEDEPRLKVTDLTLYFRHMDGGCTWAFIYIILRRKKTKAGIQRNGLPKWVRAKRKTLIRVLWEATGYRFNSESSGRDDESLKLVLHPIFKT